MKDCLFVVLFTVAAALLIAGIAGIGKDGASFSTTLIYVVVALVTITVTMMATIWAVVELGKKKWRSESTGFIAAGWLAGMFVTTPLTLTMAFRLLASLGIR